MIKVLITGAAGFIGANLCKALHKQGVYIRAMIKPGEHYEHIAEYIGEVVDGDVTKPETLTGVGDGMDIVYHLNSRISIYGSRKKSYDTIVEGTKNILNACAKKSGRFVYISSICACGLGFHLKGFRESEPRVRTGIHYNEAKISAENQVLSYNSRFKNGTVIARPANVIGKKSMWVDDLAKAIQQGRISYFDDGVHNASMIYIENLIDGLILTGFKGTAAGQIYHFCDDWKITWKDYLNDLSTTLEKIIKINLSFKQAWTIAGVVEMAYAPFSLKPPITRHLVGLMGRNNHVDTSKARVELGWKSKISYHEAMEKIKPWVKQNLLQK